jgi:hypothetical protein
VGFASHARGTELIDAENRPNRDNEVAMQILHCASEFPFPVDQKHVNMGHACNQPLLCGVIPAQRMQFDHRCSTDRREGNETHAQTLTADE